MANSAGSVAIVLAGGAGSRVGAGTNKVYADVDGRPLLTHSLAAFNRSHLIDQIVVVVRKGDFDRAAHAVQMALADKTVAIVEGGRDRQSSEAAGLAAVRASVDRGEIDIVAIHDGARPFITAELIAAVVRTARDIGGAVPGLPATEPLFELADPARARRVSGLVRMQTPQAFRAAPLIAAYDAAARDPAFSAVDTAETVERYGRLDVAVVPGDPDNIKVTYAADVDTAHRMAQQRRGGGWGDLGLG